MRLERQAWGEEARQLAARLGVKLTRIADLRAAEIEALFRDAHTLKGLLGLVGDESAMALVHSMEDLLDELRRARLDGDESLGLALSASAEALARAKSSRGEIDSLLRRLEGFCVREGEEEEGVDLPLALTRVERDRARAARHRGLALWIVESRAEASDFADALTALQGKLGAQAETLAVLPGESEPGQIAFRLLVASARDARGLEDLTGARVLPAPRRSIFDGAKDALFRLTRSWGVAAELRCTGDERLLSAAAADALGEALLHLLRNALAHGIEPEAQRLEAGKPAAGRLELSIESRDGVALVLFSDDGRGLSEPARARLFEPGFSTADEADDRAGRGFGLDVVKRRIEALGGSVSVSSTPGQGTAFAIRLPSLTTA